MPNHFQQSRMVFFPAGFPPLTQESIPPPQTGPNPPKTHINVLLDNAIIHA